MPYIEQHLRTTVDRPYNPGELNYRLTMFCLAGGESLLDKLYDVCEAFLRASEVGAGNSYQDFNDVIGALECCRSELRRRRPSGTTRAQMALATVRDLFYADYVAPYEDRKMAENGDVF